MFSRAATNRTLGAAGKVRRSFKQRISRRIAGLCGGLKAFGIEKDTQDTLVTEISAEKACGQEDPVESEQCTVEEFHYVVKALYRYAIKMAAENQTVKEGEKPKFVQLPKQLHGLFDQFAVQSHFSKVTQSLVEAVVVMDLSSDKYCPCMICEKLLKNTLVSLEVDWQELQFDAPTTPVLSNVELALFDRAATACSAHLVTSMKIEGGTSSLFPISKIKMENLNKRLSIIVILMNMDLWDNSERARKKVTTLAIEELQDDVKNWCIEQLILLETTKDIEENLMAATNAMATVIDDASKLILPQPAIAKHFTLLKVEYFKVVSMEMEKRLSAKAIELMQEVDKYQVKHHRQHEHTLQSSATSLKLYFSLRRLFDAVRVHITDRELFKTLISSYQSWFEQAVMFWLQTFRAECIKRMEKALEIEKDVVQVTSLVKYSNSSVDVISCFSKITTEWKEISFDNADIAVLGCTKIIDTICDGTTQYVERLHTILENNGYYDFIDNAQFDVTDQLCITLNNAMHVNKYLHELPGLLNLQKACHAMSVKHENDAVGIKAAEVLNNLIDSADDDIMLRCSLMIKNIVEKMAVDITRLEKIFTQKHPENNLSVEDLFSYLDDNLQVLYEKLESAIFPLIFEQIWYTMVQIFGDTLLKGKSPDYYNHLKNHLLSLREYVLRGMDSQKVDSYEEYSQLLQCLEMRSMTTQQLSLAYYQELENQHSNDFTSGDCGTLSVKLAYQEEAGTTIKILGQVCEASNLQSVYEDENIDSFVTIMLHPHNLIDESLKPKCTQIKEQTANPVFDENFHFEKINRNALDQAGLVIIFSVWHHESLVPDEFVGEVVLSLSKLKCIQEEDDLIYLPCITKSVLKSQKPDHGPMVVLNERVKKDKEAKKIYNLRAVMGGWEYETAVFAPFYKAIAKAKGKKAEP